MSLENLLVNVAENLSVGWIALAVVIFLVIRSSIKFVPQNRAFVVERFGKFNRTLTAGILSFRLSTRWPTTARSRNRRLMYRAKVQLPKIISG